MKTTTRTKILAVAGCCLLMAGGAQSAILYQDTFDGDGATNTGIGGDAGFRSINGGANWSDNGNAVYNNSGTQFQNRAIVYSSNSFQGGGFELTVDYTTSNINNTGRNLFSFGLVRDDVDLSTYSGSNPFTENNAIYGIGANVQFHSNSSQTRGLWFNDASTRTLLDTSGNNQQFLTGVSTPVFIRIQDNGVGGAGWSYSINGVEEAAGTIATFDFTQGYRFVAFGQDNETSRSLQSVTITDIIPEPSTFALLGLGALCLRIGRRRVQG